MAFSVSGALRLAISPFPGAWNSKARPMKVGNESRADPIPHSAVPNIRKDFRKAQIPAMEIAARIGLPKSTIYLNTGCRNVMSSESETMRVGIESVGSSRSVE